MGQYCGPQPPGQIGSSQALTVFKQWSVVPLSSVIVNWMESHARYAVELDSPMLDMQLNWTNSMSFVILILVIISL